MTGNELLETLQALKERDPAAFDRPANVIVAGKRRMNPVAVEVSVVADPSIRKDDLTISIS